MIDLSSYVAAEPIRPDYNIYFFTSGIFKIVNFKFPLLRLAPPVRQETPKYDSKLSQSISRSRRIALELGLCNDWAYFCTFTLDKNKYARDDLPQFKKDLAQFVLDQRKKYKKKGIDLSLEYMFIPELHADGCWHMHGMVSDISSILVSFSDLYEQGYNVPYKLVEPGFFNWPDYQKKFGFCSLGKIRNKVATSFYVTKYICKDIDESNLPVGARNILHSTGLNRPVFHGDIYGHSSYLDSFLTHDYEYVRTGFTRVEDDLPWYFAFDLMDHKMMQPFDWSDQAAEADVDRYVSYTQSAIDGFSEVSI